MVSGHLQEKNGIYYVVLTYKTYDGKALPFSGWSRFFLFGWENRSWLACTVSNTAVSTMAG